MKIRLPLIVFPLLSLLAACQSIAPATSHNTSSSISDDAVVSLVIGASDGMDEMSACLAAKDTYRFLLYRDGRLIKFDGFQYVEAKISQAEMENLFETVISSWVWLSSGAPCPATE